MNTNLQTLGGRSQRGAALVVGLILLMVLTLLAVSSMNSASLEYIMAGNEQYHSNAFQAAEAGIAQGMSQGVFNPAAATQVVNGNNTASDTYVANIVPQLGGAALPGPWETSQGQYSSYDFEIQSTGTSTRGASALNVQGVTVIAPYNPGQQPNPTATAKSGTKQLL